MKIPTSHSQKDTKQKKPRVSLSMRSWLKKIRSPLLFLTVFMLSIVLFMRLDAAFRIETVEVRGLIDSVPFKGIDEYRGLHRWEVSEEDVKNYLVSANPTYRILSVEKRYPASLVIEVSRLIPAVYLDLQDGYILLSKDGIVLEKIREEPAQAYPHIAFYQQVPYNALQRGDEIGYKEVKDSLYFLDIVQSARLKVERIDISSFYMLGLYTESGAFLFSSEKEKDLQKYQFEQSLKQLSLEGIEFDTLDFRYDKPIVRL